MDVYRAVFVLRREIFTRRPIPDTEGKIPDGAQEKFVDNCNAICATLFYFTAILNPAIPEESGEECRKEGGGRDNGVRRG